MFNTFRSAAITALLAGSMCLSLRAAEPGAGYIDLGKYLPSEGSGQFIEVNVKSEMIALAARLTEKEEPDIAELLRGLKAVRVNVFGVDQENREDFAEGLKKLRAELDTKGWERLVTVQEKGQEVGVYLKHRGEEAIEGVVVTVFDGKKEAVFVNVVGDIRPEKIAVIGEKLNIEPLKKLGVVARKS